MRFPVIAESFLQELIERIGIDDFATGFATHPLQFAQTSTSYC